MNDEFQRRLAHATRLTRAGDLAAATATIRSALGLQGAAGEPDVIDVEARTVPDREPVASLPTGLPDAVPGRTSPPATAGGPAQVLAGRFGIGVQARDWRLHLPPSAQGLVPLVVMLHGCTQDLDDFAIGTGMHEAAAARGWAVLYAAQSQRANPQRCWNWFKHSHQQRGRGEPALLADLTARVVARHGIDTDRVYVAGLSAGGAMAAVLAQAYPDMYAAVGVHSGLPAGAARDLPGALQAMRGGAASASQPAVPVIAFHGDADATVHPSNGEALFGGAGAELRTERGRVPGGRSWTRRQRFDAAGALQAEHWQVHGAPHAWSGGRSGSSYTDPGGPDATAAMLDFFAAQVRRR
jgi:poly(hydroxyalkanoate) depolymerase family esterase